MNTVPTLKSPRCQLSYVRECDFDDLHLIMKDRDVKRFLPEFYEIIESKSDFLSVMESFEILWDKRVSVLWGLYQNCELIGFIGLLDIPTNATLFYSIKQEARTQGLAKEAVNTVVSFVFSSELTDTIQSEVYTDNIASIKVLIDNGFLKCNLSEDKILLKKSLEKLHQR